jgi:uncharacterized membrane protein
MKLPAPALKRSRRLVQTNFMTYFSSCLWGRYLLLLATVFCGAGSLCKGQLLESITVPDGMTQVSSTSEALSADGSVLVGEVRIVNPEGGPPTTHVYRWSEGAMELLPDEGQGSGGSWTKISADGSIIISNRRMRWDNGVFSLASEKNDAIYSISADGRVLVGDRDIFADGFLTARVPMRIVEGEFEELSTTIEGVSGIFPSPAVIDVSGDGSVVIGNVSYETTRRKTRGCRWVDGELLALPPLPGAGNEGDIISTYAEAISDNGRVIVGTTNLPLGVRIGTAWIDGEPIDLGGPRDVQVIPLDVSGNGSVIVGEVAGFSQDAFIWREGIGFSLLKDFMSDELGISIEGTLFTVASAVSADSETIAGRQFKNGVNSAYTLRFDNQKTIVVNVVGDERDADPDDGIIDVDLDEPGEQITLRAAIELANERAGKDRIEFDIPGGGIPTIKVGLPFPGTNVMQIGTDGDIFPHADRDEKFVIISSLKATDPVEIDGTTQPGGWVEITSSIGKNDPEARPWDGFNGLEIAGGNSEIRGLVINDIRGVGLLISEKGNNWIAGNRIGTDKTGMVSKPNNHGENLILVGGTPTTFIFYAGGLLVTSDNNLIGGTAPKDRNILSGQQNIFLGERMAAYGANLTLAGSGAYNNRIIGNFIGTNVTGDELVGGLNNGWNDDFVRLKVQNGAHDNVIGGFNPGERNVIGAILLNRTQNTQILNNYIGVGASGTQILDWLRTSIVINKSDSVLIQENTIRGGSPNSISSQKTENVEVYSNRIGVFENGEIMDSSTSRHLFFGNPSKNITIGGVESNRANLISHPANDSAVRTGILRTSVGRDFFSGNVANPNENIVFVGNQIIGEADENPQNYLIDLGGNGLDAIDFGDSDSKQNFPRLTGVSHENGVLRFEGNLDSHAGGDTYHLDFYKAEFPLPSGHGGTPLSYIGRGNLQTDLDGTGKFDFEIAYSDFSDSDYFTATATRVNGSTSEFSRNRRFNESFLNDLNREAYGDRNADGLDDVDQANVASFGAANGAATTIEVSAASSNSFELFLPKGVLGFSPLDELNPTLENIESETQASVNAPVNYSYSNGILTFEVQNLSAGASVSVKLILDDDATPNTLWVLESDDTWANTLTASIDGNQVTLTLTDGGRGDRDGATNGRIVAALGPATALPPLPDLELSITREDNSHILSWPLPYSNAIAEFSPDLSPDSWEVLGFDFPIEIANDRWETTIPNPINDLFTDFQAETTESGFYRLRHNLPTNEVTSISYHTWLRNQLEIEYGIAGGEWVTGATEAEAMATVFSPVSVTRSDFLVEDQPFFWGLNLRNAVVPANTWDDFVHFSAQQSIQSGDVLLVAIWIRGVDIGEGQPTINHAFELAEPPYTGLATHQVVTTSEWTQYLIPMEATFDLPTSWYSIHLGFAVQEIEVGGVAMLNYGNKYTIDQLPKLNVP